MPTGYTDSIKDGITFEEFVLTCARAFGATITMRDDPIDKPIPDKFDPSDYHVKELTRARKNLTKINKITVGEAEKLAIADYKKEINSIKKCIEEDRMLMAQYREMLNQVKMWTPPTSEHNKLKEFMDKQITGSIEHDGMEDYYTRNPAILQTGKEWLKTQKEVAQRDIAYHTNENKKEIDRTESRTAWVKALRDSLICDKFGNEECDDCKKRFRCFTAINYKK